MIRFLEHASPARASVAVAVLLLVAGAVAVALPPPGSAPPVHEISGPTMGTRFSVKIAGHADQSALSRARTAVEAELAVVDRVFSTWRDDSEVSWLNVQAGGTPVTLSEELAGVLADSRDVTRLTGGAFDVTVAPLVRLWGFGPGSVVPATSPPDASIETARRLVGERAVTLDLTRRLVTKSAADVTLDFSAIAPGYAADRITAALQALGFTDTLVDVGGEIAARGTRHGGHPWQVGIARPGEPAGADAGRADVVVSLRDRALATSGSGKHFYVDEEGVRRAHLVDPRNGRSVEHRNASVTVVHERAAVADALSTALMVLGPAEGHALAERVGVAALFRWTDGGGVVRQTQTLAFADVRAR